MSEICAFFVPFAFFHGGVCRVVARRSFVWFRHECRGLVLPISIVRRMGVIIGKAAVRTKVLETREMGQG